MEYFFDDTDVPECIKRPTADGPGTDEMPNPDFVAFPEEGVEK